MNSLKGFLVIVRWTCAERLRCCPAWRTQEQESYCSSVASVFLDTRPSYPTLLSEDLHIQRSWAVLTSLQEFQNKLGSQESGMMGEEKGQNSGWILQHKGICRISVSRWAICCTGPVLLLLLGHADNFANNINDHNPTIKRFAVLRGEKLIC
jgi:hypothetical protein